MQSGQMLEINGEDLTIDEICEVVYKKKQVCIAEKQKNKIAASAAFLHEAIAQENLIYGVTTNFGGLANSNIGNECHAALQENLLWGLKCGTGAKLSVAQVRAGMLIRANALAKGVSGVRYALIERICYFLNKNVTPVVYEYGSIGASGDLIPLSYIAGSIIGLSADYKVIYENKEIDTLTAHKYLQLEPIKLLPKEGLALINGTSMMAGIAALCIKEASILFHITLNIHAFYIQALNGKAEAFAAFVHENKPHKGQISVAEKIRELLAGSKLLYAANKNCSLTKLVQDRYSIRCLPQYLGVIEDGLDTIKNQIEVEINSATDNPLIDACERKILHSGNFMGQYISVGMDHLRYYLALIAKHIDTQIALLVTPEFSVGLPPSLVADVNNPIKFGLKGLQICANSIMPLLLHISNNIAQLYPTHAEQYNQNINSQGYASANLAWQAITLLKHYLANALIFAVQSIELRCYQRYQNYNVPDYLSSRLIPLYELLYKLLGKQMSYDKPLIADNTQQSLDNYLAILVKAMDMPNGDIAQLLTL